MAEREREKRVEWSARQQGQLEVGRSSRFAPARGRKGGSCRPPPRAGEKTTGNPRRTDWIWRAHPALSGESTHAPRPPSERRPVPARAACRASRHTGSRTGTGPVSCREYSLDDGAQPDPPSRTREPGIGSAVTDIIVSLRGRPGEVVRFAVPALENINGWRKNTQLGSRSRSVTLHGHFKSAQRPTTPRSNTGAAGGRRCSLCLRRRTRRTSGRGSPSPLRPSAPL
jgi:hypothetical protein